MTALDLPIASAAVPRRPLPAVFLAAALGNAWSLHYASALLTGGTGLPPFGGLFTVHVLLATVFIAILSLRCELFIPTPGELGFFLLAGFLGNMVFSALAWSAAAFIAPLGFSLYAILLARRAPHRLNTLQVMTGVAVAATAILLPSIQARCGTGVGAWAATRPQPHFAGNGRRRVPANAEKVVLPPAREGLTVASKGSSDLHRLGLGGRHDHHT